MRPSLQAAVDAVVLDALGRVFPAAQVEVRHLGHVVLSNTYGWLDPGTRQRPVDAATRFDLASVSKLFVVTAFMTLVEAGQVQLDQPVHTVLPDFTGTRPIRPYEDPLNPGAFVSVDRSGVAEVDASRVTFRQLLAHNSGLPAWRPLYREPDAAAARHLALSTFFAYPPGTRVIYSDLGLILTGMALERLAGQPLDVAVAERVSEPLGLTATGYLPLGQPRRAAGTELNVAPTGFCAWRGRNIAGEVHDENAARLGGVAGHAGLFATAQDVAAFGEWYRVTLAGGRRPAVLRSSTVTEMVRLQAQDGWVRRGLGFALWSPDPEGSGYPFGEPAFGHTGFTGTSLWVDPDRGLVVATLTNRVFFGRQPQEILAFRVALHRAIVGAVGD